MDTTELIKRIELLMVETGYSKHGKKKEIAAALGIKFPTMSMALSGSRTGPAYVEILENIQDFLRAQI